MTVLTALARALWIGSLAVLLGGCASLQFWKDEEEPAAPREPEIALYELEVESSSDRVRELLLEYLDLARFQKAPKSDAISGPEIDRLAIAAPAQARALLETEGYFDADVKVEQSPGTDGLPRIKLTVVPGPRVRVKSVDLESTAPLAPHPPTREEPWSDRMEKLREGWKLKPGQPFRQADWSGAKSATLAELRADGYPTATWKSTRALVDAAERTAALEGTLEPGPLFRLGPVRIEGIHRYDERAVRNLSTFRPGDIYDDKLLLDYQERLVKFGLFEGASVELDATGPPDAAPVVVKVKEQSQHQATFGIGYSANTRGRVSLEHWNRKVFNLPWVAHTTLAYGSELKSIGTEFTAYPDANLWRHLAAANYEELKAADETRYSWAVRAGRSKDTNRFERLYYLEASHAKVTNSKQLSSSAEAVSGNYHWLKRDLDDILAPTRGYALALQGGLGYGRGEETRSDVPGTERAKGPFVRAYGRYTWFRPFGRWFANARVEAGEVFVKNRISVPDTTLFRAGGDGSVRGYDYRTLGPIRNNAVVGGQVLLTGSVELEHPISKRLPALLGAVFVDAGDAEDRWGEIRPVFGYGVGVHYRSPIGPLRLDFAYGEAVKDWRLHISVGITF
jgi:translocation and assembly module TamA